MIITYAGMRLTSNHQVCATNNSDIASSQQESVLTLSAGGQAQATSKKAFIQSDVRMTLQKTDAKSVVEHDDSAILAVATQSRAQTKETSKNSMETLTASSGQCSGTAEHIQSSIDVEKSRISLARIS